MNASRSSGPLAYCNGTLLPAGELAIPVYDAGFILGTTVAEQMRTFNGRLFRMEQHLTRLQRSLQIVGVELPNSLAELQAAAAALIEHNHPLLEAGDDLGLSLLVTPGPYASFAPADVPAQPFIAMHTYPVAFATFADRYDRGEALVVTPVQQVPAACWPPELKCRSRMHYYLADRAARAREPGARALLLDDQGRVMEASTANVLGYDPQRGLLSPRAEHILPGVTLAALRELAAELDIGTVEQDLSVSDLQQASEVFLCSTSPCLLPVVRVDGREIGTGRPGPIFAKLLAAWCTQVGLDIRAQAQRFARR